MRTSEDVKEIIKSLNIVQGQLVSIKKDTKAYTYYYATLSSILETIREPIAENGLFISQEAKTLPEGVSVSTKIFHVSGQWIEYDSLVIPMVKKDAHSTGSAITYSKRYQLCAALGIVTDDDDGEAAQNSPKSNKTAEKTDRIISKNSFDSLELTINGYEDLRKDLKKLCEVSDLRNIKSSQWNSVKNYVETFITKVNKSKQEQEK